MTMTPRFALYLLLFVSFVWGAEFVLVDLTIAQLPTNTFNGIRFILAAIGLLPLYYFSQERHQVVPYKRLVLASFGLAILIFIGFYTQTEGMRYTSVSNAGFITGLAVPLVSVLGFVFFRNRTSWPAWIGITLATVGLYFLTVGDKFEFNKGDALVSVCAVMFAFHIILTGKLVQDLPVILLSIIQLFAVGLYCTIATIISPEPAFYLPDANPVAWVDAIFTPLILSTILIAALLGTSLAYWAQAQSQTMLAPHKVALIFASEPIFAHASAWLFLDEHLGWLGLLGGAMIIAGMLVSELGDKSHPPQVSALDQMAASK